MYKVYASGEEFISQNSEILSEFPLETVFFEINAKNMAATDGNDFLIKAYDGERFLIAVHKEDFPMVIFGDVSLCSDFAEFAVCNRLTFSKVLGGKEVCESFLKAYCGLTGYGCVTNLSMDVMKCASPAPCDCSGVEFATEKDICELSVLLYHFEKETLDRCSDIKDCKRKLESCFGSFAVVRADGKIVSVAQITREQKSLAAISCVYTLPQHRNKGLSRKTVTFLTEYITRGGKTAYLFVDKNNPVPNHLYKSIGYSYAFPQYETVLIKNR